MSAPIVPARQAPPLTVITPTDHTGWIIISTALGLAYVLLFGIIRVYVRLNVSHSFGLDDALLGAATILSIIQSSIVLGATSLGLGRTIELVEPGDLGKVQQLYYAAMVLFVITLGLSKCSVAAFFRRLTRNQHHRHTFNGVLVAITLWTIGSTFAISLKCNLAHSWMLTGEKCSGIFLRWQIICALDIVTEIALVGIAIYLVWNLQISKENKAIVVTIALCLRLPVIISITFRLHSFNQTGLTSNFTLLESVFIVWTQAELCISIIAATVPSFRAFLSNVSTYYGGGFKNTRIDSPKDNSVQRSVGSYPIPNLKSSNISGSRLERGIAQPDAALSTTTTSSFGKGDQQDSEALEVHSAPARQSRSAGRTTQEMLGMWKGITANQGFSSAQAQNNENAVVENNAGQQMIIKKEITWTIERDPV